MHFLKVKHRSLMKLFAVAILNFFIAGMLSAPIQAYQNSDIKGELSVIENESLQEALAETSLLAICIAQLDISQEEKAEILAEVMGYDCAEIYALAVLFEELDNYIPFLGIITAILWWLWDICKYFF